MINAPVGEVDAQLAAIVAERPHHRPAERITGDNRYFDAETGQRQPVCLIGVWLHRHHPEVFASLDSDDNYRGFSPQALQQARQFPEDVVTRLASAQMAVDGGGTWADGLAAFRDPTRRA